MFGQNEEKKNERWKRKYYDSLEDLESREKQWTQIEAMLRNAMARLSVAMEGADDDLDNKLETLRSAIRKGADGDKLTIIITGITKYLVKLENRRTSVHKVSPTELMENLLDALELPKKLSKKKKALIKSLSEYDEESDFAPFINEYIQILSSAFDDAVASTVHDKKDSPGLLDRLFNKDNKQEQHEFDEMEVARNVLEVLLTKLIYPNELKAALDSAGKNIKQAKTTEELNYLTTQIAGVLNSQAHVEPTTETAQEDAIPEQSPVLSINVALIQLLEKLELPSESGPVLESIRAELEHEIHMDSWPGVLDRVASLFTTLRKKAQKEKKEIEEFLAQLTTRLEQLDKYFQGTESDRKDSLESGRTLSDAMRLHVRSIQTGVEEAADLNQLKDIIQKRVEAITTHVEQFRESEEERNKTAEHRVEELSERLRVMEKESGKLRTKIKEEKKLAMLDALTGINNRMAYEERSEQEFARWKRYQAPLSLIVVDIDFFKKINDNYGHVAGDKVLKTIAQLMEESVRETDFLARYGGEEFVIIMPDTIAKDAFNVSDKLRVAIENCGFHYRGENVPITISCGITEFINNKDNPGSAFERADKALYKAKDSGRNRCEIG